MRFTVAVIGGGIIAKDHLKALQGMKQLRAVAVADIDTSKQTFLSDQFGIAGYHDYRQMIMETTPDIVVITLPHYLHKEAAVFSARQGCHILLEKPMALNSKECDEILDAVMANRVQLLVGHIQHYFQENKIAKRIIKEQIMGELASINETRHMNYFTSDRPGWFLDADRSGGGIIMNIGAHCIDKIQWIIDEPFNKLTANLSHYTDRIEGSGLIYLETCSGVPVSISISGFNPVPAHVSEFIFTNGMMRVEVGKGVWVSHKGEYEQVYTSKNDQAFSRQFMELIEGISGDTPIQNTGEYGRSVIKVIESIYQADQSREMIHLGNAVARKGDLA